MANNPSFSFYVNDFEGGTRHMTDAELGCYMRLLIAQFNRGGFLPNDLKFLSRFSTSFQESWPIVKEKFSVVGTQLQNQRLEKEVTKRKTFINKQSENGSKGGRPKKPKENPDQSQTETQKKPLGNGNGKGNGSGIGEGQGNLEGGAGEENFIVPQMCQLWYENFPTYTKDQEKDFDGMGKMLQFLFKQAPSPRDISDSDFQIKTLNTLQLIADQVNREPFWVNKPIKSIANHVQEFFNKIKNPIDAKQPNSSQRQQPEDLFAGVAAVRAKSRAAKGQTADQSNNSTV